jgi:RNA 3'-terminal phosphate cyclase (ATP)
LEKRGWSSGYRQIGSATFKFTPIAPGERVSSPEWPTEQGIVTHIDITIIAPTFLHDQLVKSLHFEIDLVFPGVEMIFKTIIDSKHGSRMYTLLVAHTRTGLRFGRDWLVDEKTKGMSEDDLATRIAQKVVDDLDVEIRKGGLIDEHLQDQLLIFQALAEGTSAISATGTASQIQSNVPLHTGQPFGEGSLHTTTARWVISQILPDVEWSDDGRTCKGVGYHVPASIG